MHRLTDAIHMAGRMYRHIAQINSDRRASPMTARPHRRPPHHTHTNIKTTEPLKIITSASVKLTQTRHSHSKQLFHEALILQGFYREGQKVDTCNRKFPFESNRQIVVYSFNIKFLLTAIWDRSQMCRFVRNIARSLLDY